MPEAVPHVHDFASLLAAGDAARARGEREAAIMYYRQATLLEPKEAEGWFALGLVLHELNEPEAEQAFSIAHACDPARGDIAVKFGECMMTHDKTIEAQDFLESALERQPANAALMRQLALCYASAEKYREAVELARDFMSLSPVDADFALLVAAWCEAREDMLQAVEVLNTQTLLMPDEPKLWAALAKLWHQLGEQKHAVQALQRYRTLCPHDDMKLPRDEGKRVTRLQVRALFDAYAKKFDKDLREKLHYKAPELVRDAVTAVAPNRVFSCVIDVGCGTGLMGVAIKPQARTLIGIDLSPRMIAQAEEKKVYDALMEGDAATTLVNWVAAADLIVAADVLVYLGDLQPFFLTARMALTDDGILAFTAEALEKGEGFTLSRKRRYQHSKSYLLNTLAATGYDILSCASGDLRMEKGSPVQGWVITAKPK